MSAIASPQQAGRTIEELQETVSASRLICYLSCRLKFYFRYVLGVVKPKPPALHVGSIVHDVLKYWHMARWRNQPVTLKQLHDHYSQHWSDTQQDQPVEWSGSEEEEKTTGFKLFETYWREGPIKPDEKPEAVEVSVEADLSSHGLPTLVGVIDLVRRGGVIVDYKTSTKAPHPQQVIHLNDIQLSSYGVLYRECTGRQESGLELHHLVKTKAPKIVVTEVPAINEVQEHRLYRLMESYVDGLDREDWVPSPGLHCASCEFYGECRAWS